MRLAACGGLSHFVVRIPEGFALSFRTSAVGNQGAILSCQTGQVLPERSLTLATSQVRCQSEFQLSDSPYSGRIDFCLLPHLSHRNRACGWLKCQLL